LYSGLIRLHILIARQAGDLWSSVIDELSQHGYRLSAGTLYPILDAMERQGKVRSRSVLKGGRSRRVYRATVAGRKAFAIARQRVRELLGETFLVGN